MIIWGSRVRYKDLGAGDFYCPRCTTTRPYKHKQATRYFTLYFIPIIPMQKLGEMIECQACKAAFEMSVLQLKAGAPRQPRGDEGQMMNVIPNRIKNGDPIEYIVRDLTAAGLDLDVAKGAVSGMAGSPVRKCSSCGLTYGATVTQCKSCGRDLV